MSQKAEEGSKSPFGERLFQGVLKRAPEDFVVHECMDVVPDGGGEHRWLHIEKRGLDTWTVRDALAEVFGCSERDVGHAGLKDRHAVTRQWFSVRPCTERAGEAAAQAAVTNLVARFDPGAVQVLDSTRHARKLRIGAHRGNAFRIVVHDAQGPGGAPVDAAAVQHRAARVRALGCPNAFGEQRFGRGGENLRAARAMLLGGSRRVTRRRRGLLLSAARAHLFNRVLALRIERDDWHRLLPGEPAMLRGSRSLFVPEADDPTLDARLGALDISPTGPLPGKGQPLLGPACGRLEAETLADEADLIAALAAAGVDAARRALRVAVPDLAVRADPEARRLEFRFSLPPGSFATSLVELFGTTLQGSTA